MFKESDELTGILGKDTRVNGDLITKKLIRFDGRLRGRFYSHDTIIGGETSYIEGEIFCKTLKFDGKLKGNIFCRGSAELKENCEIYGEIFAGKLEVHDHCFINGKVHIGKFAKGKIEENFKKIEEELGVKKEVKE